jgi:hypothetical protein
MNSQTPNTATAPANGASNANDLFALTDEQILEIAPDLQDVRVEEEPSVAASAAAPATEPTAVPDSTAPAAAGPFSAPEDVRAIAELYPGGLSQAKTAAARARTLDEIDAAYFGGAISTPEQVSAARAQLAQRMMNENPAAFREMVFAGLRALEDLNVAPPFRAASAEAASQAQSQEAGLKPSATLNSPGSTSHAAQTAAYGAFERAANEELERSVGSAIERTIAQALPNLGKREGEASAGTRDRVSGFVLANPDSARTPLRERLASSVRQDVEAALKGDRQLGEQIAQILAARRFDDTARAQVVRLIGERAQQLVPGAARRVINEWTGATLAAHGAKSERTTASSARREVAPAASSSGNTHAAQSRDPDSGRGATKPRNVDYRKLSDQQILDL